MSRCATQIDLGPWYLRNKRKPFVPGFDTNVLIKIIAGAAALEAADKRPVEIVGGNSPAEGVRYVQRVLPVGSV